MRNRTSLGTASRARRRRARQRSRVIAALSVSLAAHAVALGLIWPARDAGAPDAPGPPRIVLVDLAPAAPAMAPVMGAPAGEGPPAADWPTASPDLPPPTAAPEAVERHGPSDDERLRTAQLEAEYLQQVDALKQAASRLGEQVASLTADNAALAARERAARARAEDLEREREARRRAEQQALQSTRTAYEEIVRALHGEIADQAIALRQANEQLALSIGERVLFPSGQATLTREGSRLIDKVGAALARVTDHQILVEGHTDDVAIGPALRSRFANNWELSTARATEVVSRLIEEGGIPPGRLRGAGLADTRPVAGNDTEEGRRLNRRIEVIVLAEPAS